VRLQHPLGIDYDAGVLHVADTYNHKIKKIISETATSVTYLGTGKPGHRDGQDPEFYEPGGVSVAAGKLYIADTNNHAIRVADLATADVTTLRLRGLSIPLAVVGFHHTSFGTDAVIDVSPQQVRAGQAGQLTVYLELPAGYHLNPHAPLIYRVDVHGEGITMREKDRRFQDITPSLPLTIPFQTMAGRHQGGLDIDMTFYYCRADDTGVCAIQSVRWNVPLQTVEHGPIGEPTVSYKTVVPVPPKPL
jgi:hypothetical protein